MVVQEEASGSMTETVKLGPQTCEGTAHGQWVADWCAVG